MIKLGEKRQTIPAIPEKPKGTPITYPIINLPLKALGGRRIAVGAYVKVEGIGKITGMEETKYENRVTIELHEGAIKPKQRKALDEKISEALAKR